MNSYSRCGCNHEGTSHSSCMFKDPDPPAAPSLHPSEIAFNELQLVIEQKRREIKERQNDILWLQRAQLLLGITP